MTFGNLLKLEVGKVFKNIYMYILLLLAMVFGSGIIISINLYNGPFDSKNVIGVYATLSLLFLIIICVKNVLIDFHYKTYYFYFTTAKKRIHYFFVRLIMNGIVAVLFAGGGAILLIINQIVNHQIFELENIFLLIAEYAIFTTFFTCIFLFVTLFYRNVINLLILFMAIYLILPSMFGILLRIPNLPAWVEKGIKIIPFYSVPTYVPTVDLSILQIVTVLLFILLMSFYIVYKIPKVDY
ncbi:hypothetical protein [Priestia endophytica]|uniref:ABC transporter permease n=1 Tax=Priestia endophytica TaxID=135735 RepID=A0AAX1QFG0_9BACI|nr:hypothetical protein [Priestia endophytica]RAS81730.1 hypothetical protein A3864_02575 [Priestia endophytica]RAS91406.1 hypothetical protein A3863_05845 [Priestia endophytica]